MFAIRCGRLLALVGLACASMPAAVLAQDVILGGDFAGFENEFLRANSDGEAARLANQATFGANRADITSIRSLGYENWVDGQFGVPTTVQRPTLEALALTRHNANQDLLQDDRVHLWFNNAVLSPDQLRQKLAYALGQITVTSDQNDFLSQEPVQMAEWNDIMVRNAFGNYRDLLREVSFSPMMGRYLTHLRNRKYEVEPQCRPDNNPTGQPSNANCTSDNTPPYQIATYDTRNNGNEPDENYAREVMQLFSIGLLTREPDFYTTVEDPLNPGNPLSTYDQDMIRTLTRAFTGLSYVCTGTRTVQGIVIPQNCQANRDGAPPPLPTCGGIECRFENASNLFFQDPPRANRPDGNDSDLIHPDWYSPMVCYSRYADNGRDRRRFQLSGQGPTNPVDTTIEAGATIPGGAPDADKVLTLSGAVVATMEELDAGLSKQNATDCENTANPNPLSSSAMSMCVNYCEDNVRNAVDTLFNHPSTAPMVARQLIQHFVSANPTGAYVARVAGAFEDNGQGIRGDLRATIKAVLLDSEARQTPSGQLGKVREPMLKLVSAWRSFGAISGDNRRWGPVNPQNAYFQRPLGAPSVFNFFEPDYRQPGAILAANLVSPEFQIINENSTMLTANDLFTRVCSGYNGGTNNCASTGGNAVFTLPTDRAYIPPANLDGMPGMACVTDIINGCTGVDDLALIEEINVRMMGGTMTGASATPNYSCSNPQGNTGMKGVMHFLMRCGLSTSSGNQSIGNLGQTGANAIRDGRRRKALYLIHLTSISPEFAHQR